MSWGFCFSFSYKILCKVGGLVSHIFLSIDSDFFPFFFSHFLDLSFCFENPKMSVPPFVPHHCFLSWHSSGLAAARECMWEGSAASWSGTSHACCGVW